jgi:hypothetical protein
MDKIEYKPGLVLQVITNKAHSNRRHANQAAICTFGSCM